MTRPMKTLLRLRARPVRFALLLVALALLAIASTSCVVVRDDPQAKAQASLQTIVNSALAENPSPQTPAIVANAVAVGAVLGVTVSTTGAAVTGAAP